MKATIHIIVMLKDKKQDASLGFVTKMLKTLHNPC